MQDEKKLFPGFITIFDSLGKKNALVNLELKNMNKIEGEIVEVDQNLNFALKNVKVIIEDKNKTVRKYANLFVRGSSIKYLHFSKKVLNPLVVENAWKHLVM